MRRGQEQAKYRRAEAKDLLGGTVSFDGCGRVKEIAEIAPIFALLLLFVLDFVSPVVVTLCGVRKRADTCLLHVLESL